MKSSLGSILVLGPRFSMYSTNLKHFLLTFFANSKRIEKLCVIIALAVLSIILSQYIVPLLLLAVSFVYKYVISRTAVDYFGLDPFLLLSFYIGHSYGAMPGIIFAVLFGISYLISVDFNITGIGFTVACCIVALLAANITFLSPVIAGFIIIGIGIFIDIMTYVFINGPDVNIILWHTGHAVMVFFVLTKIFPLIQGFGVL